MKWASPIWRVLRAVALVYLGVLLLLLLFENWMVYKPLRASDDWAPAPSSEIQDVELNCADGTRIHGWWLPCPVAKGALLYCHGNAGNLSHRGSSMLKLREILNRSVLIFDYPGYGKSAGRPSEAGCYQAGEAAYNWLTEKQKVEPRDILLYGGSLGGGVAVELARTKPHRGLVLVKTFTSIPDVGAGLYPWLPVRWLARNRFDNLAKIKECTQPVFIIHGDADQLIPFEHGKKLFAAANEPKVFYSVAGSDHNDGLPDAAFVALREFLAKHPGQQE